MLADKELTCKDCKEKFIFSVAEQELFLEKGYLHDPGRCPQCRAARKARNVNNNRNDGWRRSEREMFTTTCSSCGKPAVVPFKPSGEKPVYCRDCYQSRKGF